MRNDLIRAILECGVDDLSLLHEAEADMFEIIGQMKADGMTISLNAIMGEIFKEGIRRFDVAVKQRIADLEKTETDGEMTKSDYEQLEKLRTYEINPKADFDTYLNWQDTHLSCDSSKQEIYEELFEQELQELMDYTGFNVEW